MVPLLKFWFHEDVRRAAVQTLPELMRSSVLCVEKGKGGVDANFVKQVGPAAGEAPVAQGNRLGTALLESLS